VARSDTGWQVLWHAGGYRTELDDDIYGVATGTGTGYFRNIGSTRRRGIEAGIEAKSDGWSATLDIARLDATFETGLVLPSPSNPAADAMGDITVRPGNRLPGLPRQRLKADLTRRAGERGNVGITLTAMGASYLHGDEANHLAPLPGYAVLGLHGECRLTAGASLYARLQNLLDARYSTYGLLADPSGLRVPGVPVTGADPRFESPAAPRSLFIGVRVRM
jgi:outer membrane receptor protein involved in Fe transport